MRLGRPTKHDNEWSCAARFGTRSGRAARPRYAHPVPAIRISSMGWLRTTVGAALMTAPGAPMRLAGTESPTGTALLLMRTIGIRDVVLGLGTVRAAQAGDPSDAHRWVKATLASDALDTAMSLVAMRSIGRRDALLAAGLAFAFVCGDLQALRNSSERQLSTPIAPDA